MTYQEWEKELSGYLKSLPESEKKGITEYYREMYGDKIDAGMKNEEILAEFGVPMICAARILKESANDKLDENYDDVYQNNEPKAEKKIDIDKIKTKASSAIKKLSVSKIIGWFFLTVLIIIPIFAAIISIIASFAAAAISGAAMVIGGALIALASPFGYITGYTGSGVLATMGMGLAATGAGALVTVVFFLLTKYSAICFFKGTKYIFKRRDK